MTLLTDAPPAVVAPAPPTVGLAVTGPLDVTTLPRVRERIEQALADRPARLVVDLTACTFVDASALAVLLDAHRQLSRTGGVLTLRGSCPRVLRLLSLTGLRRVFDLDGAV
jgi:anti-anti-sigma factor